MEAQFLTEAEEPNEHRYYPANNKLRSGRKSAHR